LAAGFERNPDPGGTGQITRKCAAEVQSVTTGSVLQIEGLEEKLALSLLAGDRLNGCGELLCFER
jgi:hypothetical protein